MATTAAVDKHAPFTVMQDAGVTATYEPAEHLSTTQNMVAAGVALTFSAPPWLDGVDGIAWRPLADATIEIRTSAAWRADNRSPLLQFVVQNLPADPAGAAVASKETASA